jgi:sodium/potassium-transporting ATPase subunit alpha
MAMAFWSIERAGIPFSVLWFSFGTYPPEYDPMAIADAVNTASSVYFVNLVIMQFFNLMCARTRRLSILQQPPIIRESTRNYYLFPAFAVALGVSSFPILGGLILVFFFNYIPWFQQVIGTMPILFEYFLFPIAYGLGLLALEEIVSSDYI